MTACDVCKRDIFPRASTREMGARCIEHAVGPPPPFCDVCLYRHFVIPGDPRFGPCIPQEG